MAKRDWTRYGLAPIELYDDFDAFMRYVEAKARGKASQAIKKLLSLEAKTATILINGKEKQIRIDEVKIGDILISILFLFLK